MRRHSLFSVVLFAVIFCANATQADSPPVRRNLGSSIVQGSAVPPPALPGKLVVHVNPEQGLGAADAPLAIVEFADYQCPYCRNFHVGTFPKLKAEYIDAGKVRYFYKDFPLEMHKHAFTASVAAYCAGVQGQYWQMHDLLYKEQARLGDALYVELAGTLGLKKDDFETCTRSAPSRQAVNGDLSEGGRLGVHATPTFMLGRLNGDRVIVERMATGAPTYESFKREIDALIR